MYSLRLFCFDRDSSERISEPPEYVRRGFLQALRETLFYLQRGKAAPETLTTSPEYWTGSEIYVYGSFFTGLLAFGFRPSRSNSEFSQ